MQRHWKQEYIPLGICTVRTLTVIASASRGWPRLTRGWVRWQGLTRGGGAWLRSDQRRGNQVWPGGKECEWPGLTRGWMDDQVWPGVWVTRGMIRSDASGWRDQVWPRGDLSPSPEVTTFTWGHHVTMWPTLSCIWSHHLPPMLNKQIPVKT